MFVSWVRRVEKNWTYLAEPDSAALYTYSYLLLDISGFH